MTILLLAFSFILIRPASSQIGLAILTDDITFHIPEATIPSHVSLLESGLITSKIILKNFKPVRFGIASLAGPLDYKGLVTIIPISADQSFMSISADSEFSLQDISIGTGANASLSFQNRTLRFISDGNAKRDPFVRLSIPSRIYLEIEKCTLQTETNAVIPVAANGPTTLLVSLRKISCSPRIYGEGPHLDMYATMDPTEMNAGIRFLNHQDIDSVSFSGMNGNQHVIRSVQLIRESPHDSSKFLDSGGDLRIGGNSMKLHAFELSLKSSEFFLAAVGKFSSLIVQQDGVPEEFVPTLLSRLTSNQLTGLIVTWLGWVVSIFIPFISKFKAQPGKGIDP